MFFNLFKKQPPEPEREGEPTQAPLPVVPEPVVAAPEPEPPLPEPTRAPQAHHPGLPALVRPGLSIKLAPERMPSTPRTWDERVLRLDPEGFWISQEKGPDAYPVREGDTLTVVVMDKGERHVFDCPVVRVDPTAGNKRPNEVLLAPPQVNKRFASASGQGKRKHLRIEADLPGECREVRDPDLGPPVTIHTSNVSLSGLAFRANRSFESAREVEVRLLAWKFPLHLRATVVRSTRQYDGSYLVAIHFPPEISPITRDLISQFILDNQRR